MTPANLGLALFVLVVAADALGLEGGLDAVLILGKPRVGIANDLGLLGQL